MFCPQLSPALFRVDLQALLPLLKPLFLASGPVLGIHRPSVPSEHNRGPTQQAVAQKATSLPVDVIGEPIVWRIRFKVGLSWS